METIPFEPSWSKGSLLRAYNPSVTILAHNKNNRAGRAHMVAAARKAFAYLLSSTAWVKSPEPPEEPPRVGDYYADYSELDQAELGASDAEVEALIRDSKVISAKREL
jgi:hypothetical protein